MDIRRLREWQTLFAELETTVGHVDVLLNVAGYVRSGPAVEMDEVEVHRHLDINVKGVIFGSQVAAAHMSKAGSGHIVNMASLAGILSVPNYALFSAAKHAVRAYSRALGLELRGSGNGRVCGARGGRVCGARGGRVCGAAMVGPFISHAVPPDDPHPTPTPTYARPDDPLPHLHPAQPHTPPLAPTPTTPIHRGGGDGDVPGPCLDARASAGVQGRGEHHVPAPALPASRRRRARPL